MPPTKLFGGSKSNMPSEQHKECPIVEIPQLKGN